MRKFILGLLLISFYSCFRNQDFLTDDTNQLTIVSLSKANISREENPAYELVVSLGSRVLDEDIIINYTSNSTNDSYSAEGTELLIPAGRINRVIKIDLDDETLTPENDRIFNLTLESTSNVNVTIGDIAEVTIETIEDERGLLITSSWTGNEDLADFTIEGPLTSEDLLSNPITSRSQTLFIDENLLRPLPDGRYFVVLRVNSIGNNQFFDVSETVTFDFLDDQLNTFDGPYEITVNLDSNTTKMATVFTLEIIDGSRYVITPENTII